LTDIPTRFDKKKIVSPLEQSILSIRSSNLHHPATLSSSDWVPCRIVHNSSRWTKGFPIASSIVFDRQCHPATNHAGRPIDLLSLSLSLSLQFGQFIWPTAAAAAAAALEAFMVHKSDDVVWLVGLNSPQLPQPEAAAAASVIE
jgi:hypothetical protein